jgi:hypothetical protein
VSHYQDNLEKKTMIMCSRMRCPEMTDWEMRRELGLLKKGEKPMLTKELIYVCSPLRGVDYELNLKQAARYSRFVAGCNAIPVTPHLFFTSFLQDRVRAERKLGIEMGLDILTKCSQLWVFGFRISIGMKLEINLAKQLHIPIRHFDTHGEPLPEFELDALMASKYPEVAPDAETLCAVT